jgi:hypothetical protein
VSDDNDRLLLMIFALLRGVPQDQSFGIIGEAGSLTLPFNVISVERLD